MKLDRVSLEDRLSEFSNVCRTNHLAVTLQRLAIYRVLLESENHPDAEAIYKNLHSKYPTLSLATVYKTLETLGRLGVIVPVNPVHETVRYEANLDRHHHLICVDCKEVIDLYDSELDGLAPKADARHGYELLGHTVQFRGVCAECHSARNAPDGRRKSVAKPHDLTHETRITASAAK